MYRFKRGRKGLPMLRVNRKDLLSGMIVGEEVYNHRGRLLLPEGKPIEEKHIRALKIWGVATVLIDDGNNAGRGIDAQKGNPGSNDRERIRDCAAKMFRLDPKNPVHPAMKQIIVSCILRMERRGVPEDSAFALPLCKKGCEDALSTTTQANTATLTIARLIAKVKEIVSLPDIYQKLMAVIDDPMSSASDVAAVISCDPGLTARLLRIVNSAFYAFPSKIDTVSRGVTLLGAKELCDLALATSVMKLFDSALKGLVDMNLFWQHSIGCGVFARKLAMNRHEPNAERFFVMGILHDIGRLILLSHVPETMQMAMVRASRCRNALHELEKQMLGYTHADVGAALLKAWNLPASHQEAVGLHHNPTKARRFKQEAATIYLADILATAMGMGTSGNTVVPDLVPRAWDQLEIDPSALTLMAEEAENEVDDLLRIFK
jgi:HD-like signal output (HDOD) protein